MADLPDVIPIFPLPNVVLFPHVDLPLHIFEPRYRAMVRDATEGDGLVGMVVLRGDWRRDYHGAPEVFPLGCVGRIETFSPLPDGRSNLVLRGERRFTIREEIPGTEYRRARVEWQRCVPEEGPTATALNQRLKDSVSRLLARRDRELTPDFWDRLPGETERLVNTLAGALDLPTIEKLALLECDAVRTRAERLLEVLEFHLAPGASALAGAGDDEPRH
jgi:Lon protease-like protein